MSCWQDIFRHLKSGGFDVYSPGQHEGECITPYIVVKDAGTSQFREFSSTQNLYDLLCYMPKDRFSELEDFVLSVEKRMKGMFPRVRPANYKTASFYDDTVRGHMVSIQYINYRKL